LLSEIEAACDRLVVIRFGVLVYAGPTSDLMARAGAYTDVRPEHDEDTVELTAVLRRAGWDVHVVAGGLRLGSAGERDTAEINRTAASAGVTLRALMPGKATLEDVFLEMTGRDDGELASARAGATHQPRKGVAIASAPAPGSIRGSR
jgi:ABC-2 type transport system ATP-binding protein